MLLSGLLLLLCSIKLSGHSVRIKPLFFIWQTDTKSKQLGKHHKFEVFVLISSKFYLLDKNVLKRLDPCILFKVLGLRKNFIIFFLRQFHFQFQFQWDFYDFTVIQALQFHNSFGGLDHSYVQLVLAPRISSIRYLHRWNETENWVFLTVLSSWVQTLYECYALVIGHARTVIILIWEITGVFSASQSAKLAFSQILSQCHCQRDLSCLKSTKPMDILL